MRYVSPPYFDEFIGVFNTLTGLDNFIKFVFVYIFVSNLFILLFFLSVKYIYNYF